MGNGPVMFMPQKDHLFSQDELTSAGYADDKINSIYNIRYIGAAANQSKSSKPFHEWITTQTSDDRKMHLIPDGDWNIARYEEFLKARRELFLGELGSAEIVKS